jgi:hypothetical protein
MSRLLPLAAGIVILSAAIGCRSTSGQAKGAADSTALLARAARLTDALAETAADSSGPLARWVLPRGLAEVSGLALTGDQRLLLHNDEVGRIFEVDYRRGVVVKSFWLGTRDLPGDFEAIAVAGDRVFLLASNGNLYEFAEGDDGARVPFTLHDTQLGKECEFEGLGFDPAANALVMACKHSGVKSLREFVVLYRYSLAGDSAAPVAQIKVPLAQAIGGNGWKGFTPSDLSVDPGSGDYLIVASQEKGLLRLTPAGDVVWSRPLPPGHGMAEGAAITRDSLLILSDEATSNAQPGTITLYRWP